MSYPNGTPTPGSSAAQWDAAIKSTILSILISEASADRTTSGMPASFADLTFDELGAIPRTLGMSFTEFIEIVGAELKHLDEQGVDQ